MRSKYLGLTMLVMLAVAALFVRCGPGTGDNMNSRWSGSSQSMSSITATTGTVTTLTSTTSTTTTGNITTGVFGTATIDSLTGKRLFMSLLGGVGNPPIAPSTDKDTGIYFLTATGNRIGVTAKGAAVCIFDTTGITVTKVAKSDTVNTANLVATGYGIFNGAGIFRSGITTTGIATADTTKGTNAAFTGYGIINGAFIGRGGATVTGLATVDTVNTTNFKAGGYGIFNGTLIARAAAAITGLLSADSAKVAGPLYSQQKVIYIDADTSPLAAHSGALFVARPLSGKRALLLPAAAEGLRYDVWVADADSLRIVAASGDSLLLDTGAADQSAGSVAGTCRVIALDGVRWLISNATGTWTQDHGVQ